MSQMSLVARGRSGFCKKKSVRVLAEAVPRPRAYSGSSHEAARRARGEGNSVEGGSRTHTKCMCRREIGSSEERRGRTDRRKAVRMKEEEAEALKVLRCTGLPPAYRRNRRVHVLEGAARRAAFDVNVLERASRVHPFPLRA